MVLEYGVAPDALVPGLDDTSRAAILDDCIDLHLEHRRHLERERLRQRLRSF